MCLFGCKGCKVLKDENKHLRGLVDRLMKKIAPMPEDDEVDESLTGPEIQINNDQEDYGVTL